MSFKITLNCQLKYLILCKEPVLYIFHRDTVPNFILITKLSKGSGIKTNAQDGVDITTWTQAFMKVNGTMTCDTERACLGCVSFVYQFETRTLFLVFMSFFS